MSHASARASASLHRNSQGRSDRWWAIGLALAALLLYLATLAPTVITVFDDSLEFQVVLPTLGIAHPTGYPLYTLLGWLFSRLPTLALAPVLRSGASVGDLAYRVNLLSALAGALTVALLFLSARKLGSSRLAAAAASVIFAVGSVWWSQATIAEVYTLQGLFTALIVYLALAWDSALPGRPPANGLAGHPAPLAPQLAWLALVFGLALAHHRTTLLLAPGLAVFVLWTDPGLLRRPRQVLSLVGLVLLPLALYLYLPLRGLTTTSLDGSYSNTWQGFWRHVLASDYRAFLSENPLAVERSSSYPLNLLADQTGLAMLLLGLLGWLRWSEQPRRWTFLALLCAVNFVFAASYRTPDADVFYLPAIFAWLLIAACGLTLLLDTLGSQLAALGRRVRLPGPYRTWLALLQGAILLAVLAQPARATLRALRAQPQPQTCAQTLAVGEKPALNPNRARNWNAIDCGRALLDQPLPAGSTVIGLLGETTLLRYLQLADGLRPDVALVSADAEAARLAAVEAALAAGRPVFLTRELAAAPQRYSLSAQGPLIRVWPAGQASAATLAQTLDAPIGEALRLAGYELAPVPARGASWLRLQLAWQVQQPIAEELKVSARLLGPDGGVVAAQDAVPVHWAYPTTAWRAGETVLDAYDFALPPAVDAASLTPLVILYRASDGSEVGRFQG